MNQLQQLRAQIDDFMGRHPQSPLDRKQQRQFKGLSYYEENPDLVFEVALVPSAESDDMITLQTSTGDTVHYLRLGTFDFVVAGEKATLTLFGDAHGHDLFLPFKDATNGSETYGAGRYLDNHRPALRPLGGLRFVVDFNYAYNPYCAYSEAYSCPLPPRENWLAVRIEAGEKNFEMLH